VFPELFRIKLFGAERPLTTFGLLVALGFVAGIAFATRLARRYGSDPERDPQRIPDLAWWILLGVLGGGRLAYVLVNLPYFLEHPGEILAFWEGGLVMYGGLILAALLGLWKVRRYGMHPWQTADYGLTAGFLGQAIGRWGCLCVGDDYGRPTSVPWAIRVPDPLPRGSLFPEYLAGLTIHPTQIYMSLKALSLCLLGLWLLRRRRFRGQVFCVLLGGYAVLRFLIESFRFDMEARKGIFLPGRSPAEVHERLRELGLLDPAGRILPDRWQEALHQGVEGIYPQLLLSTSQMLSLAVLPLAVGLYLWLSRRPDAPIAVGEAGRQR